MNWNYKHIFLKIILPFLVTNLLLGLVLAFFLGTVDYIAHGSIAKTGAYSFGVEQATGVITTGQKIIGGVLLGCLFGINQLFVILAMVCLKKTNNKSGPLKLSVLSSAITGGVLGLLICLAAPSGLEVHNSGISCELGKSVSYQGPIVMMGDFIIRTITGSIAGLLLGLIYGIVGLILAPLNGLRNIATL
jgi:hypothetical protein